MLNFKKQYILFGLAVWLVLVISGSQVISQESSFELVKKEFNRIESNITQLDSQRAQLSKQVQSYSREIQKLKSNDNLNYFQQQKLEGLLKNSQDISNQMESIDSELHSAYKLYKETGQKLISFYDSKIKKNLKLLENKKILEELRDTLIKELDTLRLQKEQIQQKTGSMQLINIIITKLQIEPDDSPKQVEQKADLLKDQEDKLRRFQRQLSHRTKELQKELEIQTRMSDFVTDIAFFDQQEEALGDVSKLQEEKALNVVGAEDFFDRGVQDLNVRIERNLLVGQKDFDFSNLSIEQLEDVIDDFNKRELRVQAQADSLAQQAEVFYKAAKKMKKQ